MKIIVTWGITLLAIFVIVIFVEMVARQFENVWGWVVLTTIITIAWAMPRILKWRKQ